MPNAVDYKGLTESVFLILIGVMALLWLISRRPFRLGPAYVRLSEADAARLALAVVAPAVVVCAAVHSISLASTPYWQPGDWRSSWQYVAFNLFLIMVVAPALSLAGFISLWLSHRRRK
jgi:hypothetical protein